MLMMLLRAGNLGVSQANRREPELVEKTPLVPISSQQRVS